MLKNSPTFKPSALLFTGLPHRLSSVFLFTVGLSTLVLAQSASAETFYKWVDKAGSTHYTQTPPGKNSAKSAKKVYIDDLAPPTPVATTNTENSTNNANTGNSNNGNATSVMDANQLANAATNGSVPNTNGQQQAPQATTAPQSQPVITPITPPPANRLIVPTQDQTRPAFSER